jgi:hypothetical protein
VSNRCLARGSRLILRILRKIDLRLIPTAMIMVGFGWRKETPANMYSTCSTVSRRSRRLEVTNQVQISIATSKLSSSRHD